MAKIIATFSNGFTDTYNGRRSVTAAWMVTDRATGEVIGSGHSLDRARAEKTSRGHSAQVPLGEEHTTHAPSAQDLKYMRPSHRAEDLARWIERGDAQPGNTFLGALRAIRDRNAEIVARRHAARVFEIIDL